MDENKKPADFQLSFEEALEELEDIAGKLEKGSLNLDESIKCFERGVELKTICQKKIEEAERKIEILQKGKNSKGSDAPKVKKKKIKVKEDTGEIDDKEDIQGSLL